MDEWDATLSRRGAVRSDQDVAAVRDEFERAWHARQSPRIEEYLVRAGDEVRSVVLRELIALELTLRQSGGEAVAPDEYDRRFPQDTADVRAALAAATHVNHSLGTHSIVVSIEETVDAVPRAASGDGSETEPVTRIGRFQVKQLLGRGAFGRVFLAHDDELQRDVAIKVPHQERIKSAEDVAAYLGEARVLASLDHPNIVPVHDVGRTDDGSCYVVSKLIDGIDLAAYVRKQPMSFDEAARLVAVIAEALQHTHNRGLVHRDIKPANILVDAQGRPYVTDFGLALRDEDFGGAAAIAGTPAYMSPEQVRGEGHLIDGRSDIFSLGVVLYELLAGRRPFRGSTWPEISEKVTKSEAAPLRQFNESIPKELERICLKALSKRATDRYACAADMAADLHKWQAAEQTPCAARKPPKIVPKGLRSFDASDSDFFLDLLPGARDRDGLPECLRFWKTRIEETDPDGTFRLGLLYGPSGCGKSSLVKAGLLPRLADHVIPVYLEATPRETESRLLASLRRRCPDLPRAVPLVEALAAVRRGNAIPAGRKVLIVLDQFEQWLHARGAEQDTELAAALRHCDGGRVQAVLMVRDDFWVPASRLMQQLEVRLIEGNNAALVDLFDPLHARSVLAEFGRAYGRLAEPPGNLTPAEDAFLDEAVSELAQEGKVICVRLSLLADMMKGRVWTAASLREVGGTAGVGVTFLEETFNSRNAPPEYGRHQQAARKLLNALLPDSGTDIKGGMKSYEQLLSVSGYAHRKADFDDLVRILDHEVRLITPTDPEGQSLDATSAPMSSSFPGRRYYQLTHDYLVPALRDWLTRKQKETRRGRAELRLAERSALWNARQENRHLPSGWEWASIMALTRRSTWTPPQTKMMQRATRLHGARLVVSSAVLLAVCLAGIIIRNKINRVRTLDRADFLVNRLLDARISEVPDIVSELQPYRDLAQARLQAEIRNTDPASTRRLHASLALLASDPAQVDYLLERLLEAESLDVPTIITFLSAHKRQLLDRLWLVAENSATEASSRRLRAAACLAAFNPESNRWKTIADDASAALVSVDPASLGAWMEICRPVKAHLQEPLGRIFRNRETDEWKRSLATALLADYAKDDPEQLADLLADADENQFARLFPALAAHGDKAVTRLTAELGKTIPPDWEDDPLNPAWGPVEPAIQRKIDGACGMIESRFAICQTLPLEDCVGVAEALRQLGYRLVRFRPYAALHEINVAAVWLRDDKEWSFAHGLAAEELRVRDVDCRKRSLHPVDVSAYVTPGGLRFAAIWAEQAAETPAPLLEIDLDDPQWPAKHVALHNEGYRLDTHSLVATHDGQIRHCAIWAKPPAEDPVDHSFFGLGSSYSGQHHPDSLQVDVCVTHSGRDQSTEQSLRQRVADADRAIEGNSGDTTVTRLTRALDLIYLGEDERAVADLTQLIQREPQLPPELLAPAFQCRAVGYARQGRADAANADLEHLKTLNLDPAQRAYLDAVVAAYLGSIDDGLRKLEAALAANPDLANLRYYAATAYARVSRIVGTGGKSRELSDRAVALLKEAFATGCAECLFASQDPDFDSIREDPGFRRLVDDEGLGGRWSAIWHADDHYTSTELHGQGPAEHVQQCRLLASQGYRPASVSVAASPSGSYLTASVWYRPIVPEIVRERLAKRQANAALALVKMGTAQIAWPLLKDSPDCRVRSYLIHRLRPLGADSGDILRQLETQSDVGIQRALLVSLGEYDLASLAPEGRAAAVQRIREIYAGGSDPGLHSAAEWTLRRWGEGAWVDQQVDEWTKRRDIQGDRLDAMRKAPPLATLQKSTGWYVNAAGDTMVGVAGPVEFLIGSPRAEPGRFPGEQQHLRRIRQPFAIATKSVTVRQFQRFRPGQHFESRYAPTADCPAHGISWYAAAEYCNWLSKAEGIPESEYCYVPNKSGQYAEGMTFAKDYTQRTGYRLPTEAEWEYACRAGASTSRFFGESDELLNRYGWCLDNSADRSQAVALLKPNDLGLYDMHGNVWNWCQDKFRMHETVWSLPDGDSSNRPLLRQVGTAFEYAANDVEVVDRDDRVLKGGAFCYSAAVLRSAQRLKEKPNEVTKTSIGFRVARTLPSASER